MPCAPAERGDYAEDEHDGAPNEWPAMLPLGRAVSRKEGDEKAEPNPKVLASAVRPKPLCQLIVLGLELANGMSRGQPADDEPRNTNKQDVADEPGEGRNELKLTAGACNTCKSNRCRKQESQPNGLSRSNEQMRDCHCADWG